jgi:hypothetical protein
MIPKESRSRLPEKLKKIREGTRLSPDDFAPHVSAKNGKEITTYEKGTRDLPLRVLMGYWKLSGVPLEDLLSDNRDL